MIDLKESSYLFIAMVYSNFYTRLHNQTKQFVLALKAIWHFHYSRFYLAVFILLQALAWRQAWFIFHHLSGKILVLQYNVDLGITLVGNPGRVLIYPLYALGILGFNVIIAALSHRHKYFQVFTHLLLATVLLFALFLNLVLLFIYLINFK